MTFINIRNDFIFCKNRDTDHYENTPIQIYRKIHLQKLKIFK